MTHFLKPRQDMLLGADYNLDPPEDPPECPECDGPLLRNGWCKNCGHFPGEPPQCSMCGRTLDDLGECNWCLIHDDPPESIEDMRADAAAGEEAYRKGTLS